MTTNDNPDPVNRWATEHYGFEDGLAAQDAGRPGSASSTTPTRPPGDAVPRSGRRKALMAAGVLSLALTMGIGGVAVADDGDNAGRGGGPVGGGHDGTGWFDGDGGGRTGVADGGRR